MSFTIILLGIILLFILYKGGYFLSKGEFGEKRVSSILNRLPSEFYHVFNNIILPTSKGTSQIDHIVISEYGLFVIETKNYSGKVYGSENAEYWKEYFNWFSRAWYKYGHHSKSYSFYNPIRQNSSHIHALRTLLKEYGDLPFYSIIVFSNKADLHVTVYSAIVTHLRYLDYTIKQYNHPILSDNQIQAIIKTISNSQLEATEETVSEHMYNVIEAKETKSEKIRSGKCPRCGGNLILREGRYGRFYGCSNYPDCRYTYNT